MSKRNILILIDWYLPGYKAGGPIRSVANMIEHLSNDYKFWIITRNHDYLDKQPYENIVSDKWIKVVDNQNIIYLSEKSVSIKTIKTLIKNTKFDTIYINGIYSFYFSILPLITANKINDVKIVVASRGMLSPNSLKIKKLRKKLFLFAARVTGLYKKAIFHFSTQQECKDVSALKLRQKQNCIAMNLSSKTKQKLIRKIEKQSGALSLVSIARIAPEKNTLYAIECLSKFTYQGKIQFDLYGSIYDNDYWQKCVKLIEKLPVNIQINYKGIIDNSLIDKVLQNYHFSFLPSKGENFGHSIVESLMHERPVIISNKTPWKALSSNNAGWDIELNKQQQFANVIQKALELDNAEYKDMQKQAVNYINAQIQHDKIIPLYKKML